MICGNWLRLSLGSILKWVKHFKGDEKPLFINPVLGIVLWNSSGTRTEQRAVRAKVWTLLSTKKMRWKFWRTLWMLPVGQSIYNGQRNFIRLLWKRKTSITKKRLCVRLWLIMWPWRTILNCINQITEEGRIVVSYCLNPEKNVASVLIAGTGNISVAGAVSAGTNDDVTWLVCKMIAECMNAHLWKDEEFKDGLRFIFKLPQ